MQDVCQVLLKKKETQHLIQQNFSMTIFCFIAANINNETI